MYDIRRTGSVADVIRQVRDVPTRVIPYAAATGLTKTAQAAVPVLRSEMERVFDRPVAYTLNSLRVVPATRDSLSARVAVKDVGGRVPQENYLLPEVEGGRRREKGLERALRYAGLLRSGEYVVPGRDAPLDASGNLSAGTVRSILSQAQANARKPRGKRGATPSGYYVGAAGRRGTRGVWRREGRSLKLVLLFTTHQPTYRPRLDFEGVAERVALDVFPREFSAAAEAIVARNS